MTTWLESLQRVSVLVADTGDLEQVAQHQPRDATTNPSLVLKAAQLPNYRAWAQQARRSAADEQEAAQRLSVRIGSEILKLIPGRVSTEVDAALSFDSQATVQQALRIRDLYAEAGIGQERVLIKIAATWEGIRAAEQLERQGLHCNLTLLFSFAQAAACADAGVTLISPFVGRILDWHKQRQAAAGQPAQGWQGEDDPGVQSVRRIYHHYKSHGYRTEVMAASFRSPEQVAALAGCDLLTVSPDILRALHERQGELLRQLSPSADLVAPPAPLSEAGFRWQHNEDAMAVEKLAEGIRLFDADGEKLRVFLRSLPN